MFSLLRPVLACRGRPPLRGGLAGSFLFVLVATVSSPIAAADSPNRPDIVLAVHREGKTIVVDVNLVVQASPREAWDVLTDYDHMGRFVSSLTISRITGRSDGRLLVAQTSRFRFGFIALRFIPDRWIPPVMGFAILRAETRRQFGELRTEIMRRKIREGPNRQSGIHARSRFAQPRFGNSTTPPPSTESSPS